MPYEMSWYVADRVVYEKMIGHVSVDEIREILQAGEEFQKEAESRVVYYIADITDLHSLPLNIVQLRKIQLKPPTPKGMTAVVASPDYSVNSVATFFGKLMRTVFGMRFKMFPSIDAAYAHLQAIDPSLRDFQQSSLPQQESDATHPFSVEAVIETQPVAEETDEQTQPVKTISDNHKKKD